MKAAVISVILMALNTVNTWAQCAMCRTQLENNVSNGDIGIAAGINMGILYLLSMPYLIVMILGYLWYKNSRKNAQSKFPDSLTSR